MAKKCKMCDCNNAEVSAGYTPILEGPPVKDVCRPCRRKSIERDLAAVISSHSPAERSNRG